MVVVDTQGEGILHVVIEEVEYVGEIGGGDNLVFVVREGEGVGIPGEE